MTTFQSPENSPLRYTTLMITGPHFLNFLIHEIPPVCLTLITPTNRRSEPTYSLYLVLRVGSNSNRAALSSDNQNSEN